MQIEATRDRHGVVENVMSVYTFGDHVLHHLFPLVDAGKLHKLYPVLVSTCAEFNVSLGVTRISLWEAAKGFFAQMRRTSLRTRSTVVRG